MINMRFFPLLLAACVGFAQASPAAETKALDKAYCPALLDEKSYETGGMAEYKLIVRGKDDLLFRTEKTARTAFAVDEKTKKYLKLLQDKLKAKGTDLVILFPPTQGGSVNGEFLPAETKAKYGIDSAVAKANYAAMLDDLKASGINIVGVTDYPEDKLFFFKRDHHWNPDGAKASAIKVAEFVKTLPVYETLPKTQFVTKEGKPEKRIESYSKAVARICKKKIPPEMARKFTTEPAEAKTDQSALFDEVSAPSVVLVGTSNTAPLLNVANFEGFLKEALSLDLQNLAIDGAGIDTALLSYLGSEDYKKSPAKLIIWEIPGYYDFNVPVLDVAMNAIPMLQGDCKGNAVAEANGVAVMSGETEIMEDIGEHNIVNEKQYLVLEFSNPPKHKFIVDFWSGNRRSMVDYDRHAKYTRQNDPFIRIVEEGKKPGVIGRVSIRAKEMPENTTVNARICNLE